MDAVIKLAQQQNALLACANDPDADRFAVAVRDHVGEYKILSGDQIGILLGAYLLAKPQKVTPIICATIVSSSMLSKIATAAGAVFHETLTGFKWLCNVAQQSENEQQKFLFAYEEAIGYAAGRAVWDKDGLSALVMFVQMVGQLAAKDVTVFEELERLYTEFGLHMNLQKSIALAPDAPPIGDLLRRSPPIEIAGKTILQIDDLKYRTRTYADGRSESIALPANDVLIYKTEGYLRVIVRPSGTEPKLKCYYELIRTPPDGVQFSEFEIDLNYEIRQIAKQFQSNLELLMRTPI
jgi:phosphomannomutase